MKERLRLRDLDNISRSGLSIIDLDIIVKEIFGFKNPWYRWIGSKKRYRVALTKAVFLVEQARRVDPKDIIWDEGCPIKRPANIDYIPFRAMMELQSILGSEEDVPMQELFADIITIVCYTSNVNEHYDSECEEFKQFRQQVLDQELFGMIGMYNWINESLLESNQIWTQRFFEVELQDPDYQNSGGDRMNQFNVLSTIKALCNDFNCTYEKAWQLSYSLTQTNSYSKAVASHIQDNMRRLKEARMKASRESNNN